MSFVVKRNGAKQSVSFDKISKRIQSLCTGLDIDVILLAKKVISNFERGISTVEIDTLTSELCATMGTKHPDYLVLASRLSISNLHKQTDCKFSDYVEKVIDLLDQNLSSIVRLFPNEFNSMILDNDHLLSYFSVKTLEKSYLLKKDNKIVERPQYMFLRVSIAVSLRLEEIDILLTKNQQNDISKFQSKLLKKIQTSYELFSNLVYTHATPTLFNAGTKSPSLSSCFLVDTKDDIESIFDTIKECSIISKYSGGIGINIHDIRADGSYIQGINGYSSGIVPMLRTFNSTARYINQGGKRPGSIAIYLEPHHPDILAFLDLKKNTGIEELRARDLFYSLWISDLFMQRVSNDDFWSLFCPNIILTKSIEKVSLSSVYGDDYVKLYLSYEKQGISSKVIKARDIWTSIINSQVETGTPYMVYKDSSNKKSNHNHLGCIKSSNLCSEIIQYSDENETAVCNLASISLPAFVEYIVDSKEYIQDEFKHNKHNNNVNFNSNFQHKSEPKLKFNFNKLVEVCKIICRNMNNVIDINKYPSDKTKRSNMLHRPFGIGVQGLADVFMMLRYPFTSKEAKCLNKQIHEAIYYGLLKESCKLSKKYGPYKTYNNSLVSKGILQQDLWKSSIYPTIPCLDWESLRDDIRNHGLYNSLTTCSMPTASTSIILQNNESIEPYTSNVYSRQTLSGSFIMINKHLLKDLIKEGLWNDEMKNEILYNYGSIQSIKSIPNHIKSLYLTAFEMSMKDIIDMSADRSPYIDQSQSLNLFVENTTFTKINAMHFYAWSKGLKTGMYYLRTKSSAKPIQITVEKKSCSLLDKDCLSCSA